MSYMKENLKKQSHLVACLQCWGFVDKEIKNQAKFTVNITFKLAIT